VSESLTEIVLRIRKLDGTVTEIASASREQTSGIEQINTAVSQMDKVVQASAATAEETAAAAEQLNAQSMELENAVTALRKLIHGQTGSPT